MQEKQHIQKMCTTKLCKEDMTNISPHSVVTQTKTLLRSVLPMVLSFLSNKQQAHAMEIGIKNVVLSCIFSLWCLLNIL